VLTNGLLKRATNGDRMCGVGLDETNKYLYISYLELKSLSLEFGTIGKGGLLRIKKVHGALRGVSNISSGAPDASTNWSRNRNVSSFSSRIG